MHWPEGAAEGTWMPVAQEVQAASMREAVEKSATNAGRYRVTLAELPGMQGSGLVRLDPDGTAVDVEAF